MLVLYTDIEREFRGKQMERETERNRPTEGERGGGEKERDRQTERMREIE